ncbi:DUF2812 domain-containing protein [Lutispora thermophila]|uniref:DUF2812 domain-containing protein n=1 Tax=Lutispora thermophila DSM 19022 TaxID=1122184 RepID=A0A1M6D1K5_9FIRM|nr:DUF2812 domain-containing protein [Lutispora thermophila]SHI66868.1 Protein of unknown function [Lutispora thermophila DSM 19022]
MAKYKMCSGLAMMPEHDMKLLKDMSKKGWHLVGMKGLLYRFEKGDPCDYDYALNMELTIDKDMLSYYEASGWHPVVIGPGYQIFRAKEGTVPIFSDKASEEEVLLRNQKQSGKWASVFGILLAAWLIIMRMIDLGFIESIVLIAISTCFVFTFLPYLGFSRSLRKLRKNIS